MNWYGLGDITDTDHMLKFTDSSFYIVGKAPTNITSMRRIDISNPASPTLTWGKYMNCMDGSNWGVGRSYAILNSDGTKIHTLTATGAANSHVAFASLSSADGSLQGSVFASSELCTEGTSARLNGDRIYFIAQWPSGSQLMIYNETSNNFTQMYTFGSGNRLSEFVLEFSGDM